MFVFCKTDNDLLYATLQLYSFKTLNSNDSSSESLREREIDKRKKVVKISYSSKSPNETQSGVLNVKDGLNKGVRRWPATVVADLCHGRLT